MLKTVSSITNAIGALNYKGTWNASTNTPTIVSSAGTKGDYYVVSVSGTTTIDGISNWGVGDWITFNGSVWQRVEGGADLNGVNLSVTGNTTLGDTSGDSVTINAATVSTPNGLNFDSDTLVIDAANNRVGIGASAPAAKLEISSINGGVTDPLLANTRLRFTDVDTTKSNNQVTGGIEWYTADTDDAGVYAYISSATNSGGAGYVTFATGSSSTIGERMRISSIGIVTMSAYGAGTATFSAAGIISSVSDETWKIKDGVPIDPDAMIQMLEPGYWYYNEEKAPTFGADRQLGFYAQNVNAAIGPEAAPAPEEGKPWGYYDRSVLAVTVMSLKNALNSIQEQQTIINSLKARLDAAGL